ncbi:MAG: hypothetical protein U0271_01085 [Polyangiaceae bacterium]
MKPLLGATLLATALGGCSPFVLHDFGSVGDLGRVRVTSDGEAQWLEIGERELGPYDHVAIDSLVASPDGRSMAWVADSAEDGVRVILDGRQGPSFEGIGQLAWGARSDRLVYAAMRNGRWVVATPEGLGRDLLSLGGGRLSACPRGAAYTGRDERGAFVVVADATLGPFDAAGGLHVDATCDHFAFAAQQGEESYVFVDGERFGPYLDVAEVALAPTLGRFAATVWTADGWRVLADGSLSKPFARVSSLAFSANAARLVYAAEADGLWWIVDEAPKPTGPFAGLVASSVVVSDAGDAYSFVAEAPGGYAVYRDGVRQPGGFRDVSHLAFAPRTSLLGYVGRDDSASTIFIGGVARGSYDAVGDLALGPGGAHYLAIVISSGISSIVVDDSVLPYDVVAPGSLTFDETGEHWAAIAGDRAERSIFFVVDGARGRAVAATELADRARSGALELSFDDRLRAWLRAELRAHTQTR